VNLLDLLLDGLCTFIDIITHCAGLS